MILLGAGASVPLGLPTMQELTDVAIGKVSEFDRKLGDAIIKKLGLAGMKPDFEAVYTILEALTQPNKAIIEAGPFAAYLLSSKEDLKPRTEVEPVLRELRRLVYEKCKIERDSISKLIHLYDHLFASTNVLEWDNVNLHDGNPGKIRVSDRIVTTNYDMALELYFQYTEKPFHDGFEPTKNPLIKQFTPYQLRSIRNMPWLWKLHGSIWQFWSHGRIIKTIEDPRNLTLPIDIEREMMIYPNKEKPILQDPYFTTYAAFKLEPWFRLVVVGYSFRDDPVNTAIADNMDWNPEARILIIDPRANEVRKELPDRLLTYSGRIESLEVKFEKDRLELDIANWLGSHHQIWANVHQELLQRNAFTQRIKL